MQNRHFKRQKQKHNKSSETPVNDESYPELPPNLKRRFTFNNSEFMDNYNRDLVKKSKLKKVHEQLVQDLQLNPLFIKIRAIGSVQKFDNLLSMAEDNIDGNSDNESFLGMGSDAAKYFPKELHSVIPSLRKNKRKLKRKADPVVMDGNLSDNEEKTVRNKNVIVDTDEEDEQEREEIEKLKDAFSEELDGDYGVNHIDSDMDELDDDKDNEPMY